MPGDGMNKKTIAIVHNAVKDDSLPDEQDVLTQVAAVSRALTCLGYEPEAVPCTLDLNALKQALTTMEPFAVFNLVESLEGQGRLIHVVPALVEALGFACTGCSAEAIFATSHKVMAKERMVAEGLPTARWINPVPPDIPWKGGYGHLQRAPQAKHAKQSPETWIIKSLWEHASLGLEQENLVTGTRDAVAARLQDRAKDLGGACFAEQYIEGREFNLSLIDTTAGVRVLPPAEIVFRGFKSGQPRIVGYRAKWMPDSAEYQNTSRSFDFPSTDTALVSTLERLALACWHSFGLKGYARVDFRVDTLGNPFILEVNANPCISPDAGFSAALEQAGISHGQGVAYILKHRSQPIIKNNF